MNIYQITAKDAPSSPWMFFEDDASGGLRVRSRYSHLVCDLCGKLDEDAALAQGVDESFRVRTTRDWLRTNDEQICVSSRFREVYERSELAGLDFSPLPSSPTFHLAVPTLLVASDPVLAGFKDVGPVCPRCKRPKERVEGPFIQGLDVPDRPRHFFAAQVKNENLKVAYRPLFCDEEAMRLLRAARLNGLGFFEAF